MVDDRISKFGRACNAATQHVANAFAASTKAPASDSLQRVSDAIIDKLAIGDEPRYYHEDLDKGTKGDILRPIALGFKAGAAAAYAYEQGAKFLVGRGQRHQDFAYKTQIHDEPFTREGYEPQVAFKHSGDLLTDQNRPPDAAQEKQRSAAFYKNNLRAIKQDGILGLAVKATAIGVGTLIGAAFCGSDEKADMLSARLAEGAHAFNAGARAVVLGVPMAAAALTGASIGLAASAAVAGWMGLRALYQHAKQKPAPAAELHTQPELEAAAELHTQPELETAPELHSQLEVETAPELHSQPEVETVAEPQISTRQGALEVMDHVLQTLAPGHQSKALPAREDMVSWELHPAHATIEWAREKMYPISKAGYDALAEPEKETWRAINVYMLNSKPPFSN